MISDTLSDAAAEIREYLDNMPDVYRPTRGRILGLLELMDDVRKQLDTPPGQAYSPGYVVAPKADLEFVLHKADLYDTGARRGGYRSDRMIASVEALEKALSTQG